MRKKNKLSFQKEPTKKKMIGSIIFIAISIILSVSIIVWLSMNDWNVQKSVNRIVGEDHSEQVDETPPVDEDPETGKETVGGESPDEENDPTPPEKTIEEAIKYIEGQELPEEPTYVDGLLIANKRNPLPSTFAPGESSEARSAFDEMAAAALLEDYRLIAFSTYRSYDRQVELYNGYVARDGVEEADRYSARPGYSEHQTGLAFDIGEVNKEQHWASTSFAETEAGKWLAENAHLYGFIMRYPEGKEFVTGYMYESWHFRYVGKEIAKDIYSGNGTLEEYLGL